MTASHPLLLTSPTTAVAVAAEKACSPDLPDIVELASTTPDLSTLLAAVQAVNLTDFLSSPGPIDVFAPTNDAFAALLSTQGITAEQLLAETDLVTRVLQLHVTVPDGVVCSGDLNGTVPTALAGESLDVTGDTVTAGGSSATIIGAVNAGNGVVYLIDNVLLPTPDPEQANATASADGQLSCPPEGFDSVPADSFNIQAYISKPWFIQEQMPLAYQTEDQLYCVRAAYKQIEEDLFEVYNYANVRIELVRQALDDLALTLAHYDARSPE